MFRLIGGQWSCVRYCVLFKFRLDMLERSALPRVLTGLTG